MEDAYMSGIMSGRRRVILLVSVLVLIPIAVSAATIHVPGDASTIQAGINMAAPGDVVLVAPGTYHEQLHFFAGHPAMTVISESGPLHTVVDAQFGDRVVRLDANPDPIVLEGFTLRHGYTSLFGAGVACFGGNLVLRGNIIKSNHQVNLGGGGGGVYISAASHAETLIEYNLIVDNVASNGCGIWTGRPILVRSNTLVGNASPDPASGGGGILCTGGFIENNIIVLNHADDSGGIYCNAPTSLTCNDLWSNTDDEVYGPHTTSRDFSADPLFCAPLLGDYTLDGASPCLPGASPASCGLVGAYDHGCGPIAVEPATWGRVKAGYRD
jgi:hypothetical protein